MKRKIKAGTTSVMEPVRIFDSSSTTGGYLGSLTSASSGLTFKWRRRGDAAWTNVVPQSATAGTFTSGGFAVPTSGPTGSYEIHTPDAAFLTGAQWVEVEVYGVANMVPVRLFYELDTIDYQAAGGKVPATIAAGDLATDSVTAASVKADAVTKIQVGLMLAASYTAPPSAATISTQVASDLATAHGAGSWATATGFAVPGSAMTLTSGERTSIGTAVWVSTTRTLSAFGFTVDATLNATQTSYAPSKAGDAMTLTAGERTTLGNVFWNLLAATAWTAGSMAARIVSYLTGDAFQRLGAPAGASFAADVAAVKADTAAIKTTADQVATTLVQNGLVYQFTAAALALAPTGGGGGGGGGGATAEEIDELLSENHGAGQWGGNLTVTPLSAVLSAGEIQPSGEIAAYQFARFGTYSLGITDTNDEPVNLVGKDLRFIAYRDASRCATSKIFELTSTSGDLVVSGDDGNQVTIDADDTVTQTAREGFWAIRNMTDDRVVAVGSFVIKGLPDAD